MALLAVSPALTLSAIKSHTTLSLLYLCLQQPLSRLVKYLAALLLPMPSMYSLHRLCRLLGWLVRTAFGAHPWSRWILCGDAGSSRPARLLGDSPRSIAFSFPRHSRFIGLLSIRLERRFTVLSCLLNVPLISSRALVCSVQALLRPWIWLIIVMRSWRFVSGPTNPGAPPT